MKIDWTKPIQTADGRAATLVGEIPDYGTGGIFVVRVDGEYKLQICYSDGSAHSPSADIENAPPPTPPGEKWTPVSTPPTTTFTVLLTDCPEENNVIEMDQVFTGHYGGERWYYNTNDPSPRPTHWRNLRIL